MQSADPHKPHDAVQAAMQKVNEAVGTAEKQLERIESLPSARLPRQVCLRAALTSQLAICALVSTASSSKDHDEIEAHYLNVFTATNDTAHCMDNCSVVFHYVQVHPYVQLAAKVLVGALAITCAYQSQLYSLWLQFLAAAVAAVLVAAYGFSRSSLSSSGQHAQTSILLSGWARSLQAVSIAAWCISSINIK